MKKVLAIHLDAFDPELAYEMMAAGEMPAFSKLADQSARFELKQGVDAIRTGLTGEQFVTGLSPSDSNRWDSLHFYPDSYDVWQQGASLPPFTSSLPIKTVVFDTPYFDLENSPNAEGIVSWGAHDPGVYTNSRPNDLLSEVIDKFGTSPAQQWHHELIWNSPEQTQQAVDLLLKAVSIRGKIVEWLLTERIKDWDFALFSIAEAHSAIEGMWHGIDTNHPLHSAPSAKIAGAGIRSIYKAIDKLVGRVTNNIKDTAVIIFSMHGMGPNRGDTASFLLLAELMYRHSYGKPYFNREGVPSERLNQRVDLLPTEDWTNWVKAGFPKNKSIPNSLIKKAVSTLSPLFIKQLLRRTQLHRNTELSTQKKPNGSRLRYPVNWIPAMRYKPFWPNMSAFAIPSYFDGRVRINLKGREKYGVVSLGQYEATRNELVQLINECKDPITGQNVVDEVVFPEHSDPRELNDSEADITVVWNGAPTGIQHPEYGKIGPVPYRRTGGHTGGNGFAYVAGTKLEPGNYGTHSSYDVTATLADLLVDSGESIMSGSSLLSKTGSI